MPSCRKCGKPYRVLGEDDGLCPGCTFDELVGDDSTQIYPVEAATRRSS